MTGQRAVVLAVTLTAGAALVSPEPLASGAGVAAAGAYSLALPGFSAGPAPPPKALLWCQGESLLGVVVPDEKSRDCGPASQRRPRAVLLRDGRCGADGGAVSFGFLVSRTAWVVESASDKPEGRTMWLLHRFEGSVRDGRLSGVLVQVDISHPGRAFEKKSVAAPALVEEQPSFADEGSWRTDMGRRYCLAPEGP
jgi:hypothetical protein